VLRFRLGLFRAGALHDLAPEAVQEQARHVLEVVGAVFHDEAACPDAGGGHLVEFALISHASLPVWTPARYARRSIETHANKFACVVTADPILSVVSLRAPRRPTVPDQETQMRAPTPKDRAATKLDGQASTLSDIAAVLGVPMESFLGQAPPPDAMAELGDLVSLWRGLGAEQRRRLLDAARQIAAETR
jgi:hypothetical protein